MLSLTNTWQCDIWPHAVRLRRNNVVLATHERRPDESLEAALKTLLRLRPSVLPWRDAVEFHLDTDDLTFLIQPWHDGVTAPQELLQLARQQAVLRASPPVDWQVRFETLNWQQSALAACLKQPCWHLLVALARRERLRFRGVVTPFQQLFSHFAAALPENGLFVAMSPHHSRIASRQHHSWRDVWTLTLPQQEMDAQLRVIARLSGMQDCPGYVIHTDGEHHQEVALQESPHDAVVYA